MGADRRRSVGRIGASSSIFVRGATGRGGALGVTAERTGLILLSMRANNLPAHPPEGAWVISADDCLYMAGLLIFVAMIFDVLDGSVARLTKSTSKFGMDMDSLCDPSTADVTGRVVEALGLSHLEKVA